MTSNQLYIRPKQVCELLGGISKATLWRWSKQSNFPTPIKIGGRAIAYDSQELQAFIDKRKAERDQ